MSPDKMPPDKMPPDKMPPNKMPLGQNATRTKCHGENCYYNKMPQTGRELRYVADDF